MHRVASLFLQVTLGLGAAGALVVACSSGGTSSADAPGAGGKGGSGGFGASGQGGNGNPTGGTSGEGGSSDGGAGGGDAGSGNAFGGGAGSVAIDAGKDAIDEGCAGVEAKATRVPLTLFIALDRSSSLSGAKWDAALKGLGAFLKDPVSAGIDVGLVTFPRQPLLNPQECSFSNYKDPEVPFAKLPGNAQPMLDFLATVKPNGFGTPIYPALGGTLERAAVSKIAKPLENFAVLLVTDGEPAQPPATCNGVNALSTDSIGAFVADTFEKYQVKTFVIGLPGIPKSFADTLAQKGGTQAIVIQQDVDLEKQFQGALSAVLGEGLGCEFPLPPDSSKYDKDLVNVNYTKGDGSGTLDLKRSVGCKDGVGWDYDSDTKPTKLVLCGSTCEQVKKDGLAKIDVILGCPTRIQ
jgi:Mg-chelatase subunit ChlD